MTNAFYPGTFDPATWGHIDIAIRAARIFDHLTVAVYDRPLKNLLFSTEERVELLREALRDYPRISVERYAGLTVNYAHERGFQVIVRGLRAISDFELEYQMASMNFKLAPDIETVCLMTSLEYAFVSSSIVKEIALAGGPIEDLVPPHVSAALHAKTKSWGDEGPGKVKLVSLKE